MMITFIIVKSSLVPLTEGLCAQIYFRFEISVEKTPPKWKKNNLVSGGHGHAGSWRGR